jgi:plasmid maintenance system antidote protein VapI
MSSLFPSLLPRFPTPPRPLRIDVLRWKVLLLERGIKQSDLAPYVGLAAPQLSRAVHGHRALLPVEIDRLAAALGVDPSAFLLVGGGQ